MQKALNEITEEYGMEKSKWDKEQAILKQKVEFLESQLQDSKASLDDARKSHEAMMNAIQNKEKDVSVSKEEAQKKIE
jgi:seryl-tRNA synthetase